jgi:GNAT superfamily N-acetyltransferase
MIRDATKEDFDQILDCCEEFWAYTRYKEPFCREHTRMYVQMAYDHGLLAVVDIDEIIVGFVAGVKSALMGNPDVLTGTELAWWISPGHRKNMHAIKLLKFIEGKAQEAGIKYWNMVSMQSSMPEEVNALYEKMGYEHSETSYTKVM